jgi:hypothetical protein
MRFCESEDTTRSNARRIGCIPIGTFYGKPELVPPGTFH